MKKKHTPQENQMIGHRSKNLYEISPSGTFMLVMASFILALICPEFITLAPAHTGLDPEVEEITELLTKKPNSVDLLVRRGQVYRSNGKLNASLQDLEQAWLLDSQNRTVLLERALTLSALNRNSEAEAALNAFLQQETDPKRIFALAERGYIRERTGRVELAIADFTEAIQLQPTVELYLIRGKLQESMGKLDEAASGYQDGLDQLGEAVLLKKGLIRVQIAQKHYDEALNLVNGELARASVKTPWYLERAEILSLKGHPDASRLAYEQALSEANRVLGKRPTAVQLLSRAKVYHKMGRMAEAKRDLHMAVKKAPQFEEADKMLKKLENQ